LSVEHRADDELYREAETLFGTNALMDIAVLVGTYHMACATLTTFAIPAPG
jgi:4-carboxymuconolactone decarboxylase